MHEFLRKYVFGLGDQNTTLGNTSFIEVADGINEGDIHAKTARERNIEDGSIKEAREPGNKYLEHLV